MIPIHLQTYTGKVLDLSRIDVADIDLMDIAHSLSNINRYNGHASRNISVALHAYHTSKYVQRINPLLALEALHHDDAEAYVGDVTRFVKHMPGMEVFRTLEDKIQLLCFRRFGIDTPPRGEMMSAIVEEADRLMLRFEATTCFEKWIVPDSKYKQLSKSEFDVISKTIGYTKKVFQMDSSLLFLHQHRTLMGERHGETKRTI